MKGWEKLVAETIKNPDVILHDADFIEREVFYRYERKKKKYIKVVVEKIEHLKIINVKTAFPTDSVKQGEDKVIWIASRS